MIRIQSTPETCYYQAKITASVKSKTNRGRPNRERRGGPDRKDRISLGWLIIGPGKSRNTVRKKYENWKKWKVGNLIRHLGSIMLITLTRARPSVRLNPNPFMRPDQNWKLAQDIKRAQIILFFKNNHEITLNEKNQSKLLGI